MLDFKVGDEVVCVDKYDGFHPNLTPGKTYTITRSVEEDGLMYVVVLDDKGVLNSYFPSRFKLKEQPKKEPTFQKFYIATNFDGDFGDPDDDDCYNLGNCSVYTSPERACLAYCRYHSEEPKYVYEVSKRFIRETNFVEG